MANNDDTNETAPGRGLMLQNVLNCCKADFLSDLDPVSRENAVQECLGFVQEHYETLDFGTTGDGLGHVGAVLAVTRVLASFWRTDDIQRSGARALRAVMVPEGFIPNTSSQFAGPVDHSDLGILRQAIQSKKVSGGGYDLFAECFLTASHGWFMRGGRGKGRQIPSVVLFATFLREDRNKNAPGRGLTLQSCTQQYFCKQIIALVSGEELKQEDAVACLGYLQDHYARVDFDSTGGGLGHVGAILAVTNAMKQSLSDPEIQRSGRSALLAMLVPEAFIPDSYQAARLKDLLDLGDFREALRSKILQEGGYALFKDSFSTVCEGWYKQLKNDPGFADATSSLLLFATFFQDMDFVKEYVEEYAEDHFLFAPSKVILGSFIDHTMELESVRPLVTFILDALLLSGTNMLIHDNGAGMHRLIDVIGASFFGCTYFVAERIHSSGCLSVVQDYIQAKPEVESQLMDCMLFFWEAGALHPESAKKLYEIGFFTFIVEQMNGPFSESEKFNVRVWAVLGSFLCHVSLTITEKSKLIQTLKESAQKFPDLGILLPSVRHCLKRSLGQAVIEEL